MLTDQSKRKSRLLIIDDDPALLEILTEYLDNEGFEIKTVQKTVDLFKEVTSFDPQLVILDYLLDGINGGELCHQLKRSDRTKHIPIILYSAYPRVLLSLGTYGCDLFVPKPFDLAPFKQNIRELIDTKTGTNLSAASSCN